MYFPPMVKPLTRLDLGKCKLRLIDEHLCETLLVNSSTVEISVFCWLLM